MSPSDLAAHEKREFASEIKFLLDPATATAVREWARARLVADPNAEGFAGDTYTVTSLYFDTPELDVFHRQGLHRHSKFRIRRYSAGSLFFERKLKIRGRLAKHRTPVTLADVADLSSGLASGAAGFWFQQKISARRLQPQCQIGYRRTARVLMSPAGPIRMTLDDSVCAQRAGAIRFDDSGAMVPVTDRVILELKFRRDLPALFRELVASFALNPVSFSKYRAALPLIGLVPGAIAATVASEKKSQCQSS
jgi:VTC domain